MVRSASLSTRSPSHSNFMDPGFITTHHAVRKQIYTLGDMVVSLNLFAVLCCHLPFQFGGH